MGHIKEANEIQITRWSKKKEKEHMSLTLGETGPFALLLPVQTTTIQIWMDWATVTYIHARPTCHRTGPCREFDQGT